MPEHLELVVFVKLRSSVVRVEVKVELDEEDPEAQLEIKVSICYYDLPLDLPLPLFVVYLPWLEDQGDFEHHFKVLNGEVPVRNGNYDVEKYHQLEVVQIEQLALGYVGSLLCLVELIDPVLEDHGGNQNALAQADHDPEDVHEGRFVRVVLPAVDDAEADNPDEELGIVENVDSILPLIEVVEEDGQ